MIAVRLMGGLGNQMFQYAVARRLSFTNKTALSLDHIFFDNIAESDTPREYELDCFNIQSKTLVPSRRPQESPEANYSGKRGRLQYIKDSLAGKAWRIYREPHHQFDPNVLTLPNSSYLIGYWQSEKYFSDIREQLLKDFSFKTEPKGKNIQLLKDIQNSESISIHVRRGDYVSNKNASKFHGTKDESYYDEALKRVLKTVKNPKLFVFSDDPEWCKKNLKFKQETVYVEENSKGFEDMRLMMNCKHNIIANSSFSWWAAWLNQNPDKIVVAPKKWFNDPSVDTRDVVPKTWVRI